MIKDGILLAGGTGSRLKPFTSYISKHLLNVGGKPIIDYPIDTLKQLGVENLTIVVGSSFSGQIMDYVQDGSSFGMNVNFIYQPSAVGIAQAINICKPFVKDKFMVCLGDNIFEKPIKFNDLDGAQIALTTHKDIHKFGVAICTYWAQSIDGKAHIHKLEEKPKTINKHYKYYVITGCYQFDQNYFEYFKNIKPSSRNEFEITEIIQQYHNDGKLNSTFVDGWWQDAGTIESLQLANNLINK
jgi:glucose-1-phosphate thymidylyltransferase